MSNYAPQLPRDKGDEPIQEAPAPKVALTRYSSENSTASSVISFSHDTTLLEIAAVGGGAAMRWVATSDTQASVISIAGATANFDHVIPSGSLRRFVIPREAAATTGASVVGVNRAEGLYQRVAIKSFGIASVLTSEF